ncbi:heme ABC exporter ATP-binding protein CcmA [Enterovirga aerilata]|uniref:Heme ABC exporter ATP-binding protein CcmA n=1 Tax=Enterovirga aerilata TaxID=2730920 RepID=A0A849I2F4_9HYPH|nr:heme ABC exporter ATP-binding protein CcmA [Enterovirga sp. DB1703]NNM73562.1 heme ABC exporter ATP-binding protein CcmA [Enterovirga sp. DB1703]
MQLAVDNLACRRAGRRVFDGLSFRLGPGEALAVTGRNGAGKSTLLGAIAGLVGRHAGEVSASGIGDRTLAESLHLVGHRDGLKGSLTAEENLAFAAALLGSQALAPADALARTGLPGAAQLPVAYLSAGQRRRVALARLLVAHRPLWLLDEPLTALDTAGQSLLAGIMAEHLAGGGLILAATHAPLPIEGAGELRLGA